MRGFPYDLSQLRIRRVSVDPIWERVSRTYLYNEVRSLDRDLLEAIHAFPSLPMREWLEVGHCITPPISKFQ